MSVASKSGQIVENADIDRETPLDRNIDFRLQSFRGDVTEQAQFLAAGGQSDLGDLIHRGMANATAAVLDRSFGGLTGLGNEHENSAVSVA